VNHLKLAEAPEDLLDIVTWLSAGILHVLEGGGLLKAAKYPVRPVVDDDHPAAPDWIEQQLMIWIEPCLDNLPAANPAARVA